MQTESAVNTSHAILLLIGQAVNPKSEREKQLKLIEQKLDNAQWSLLVLQAIQQCFSSNHYRADDRSISGLIPPKAILKLFMQTRNFKITHKKLMVHLWNDEVTKLEMNTMEHANWVISPKYRIKISFIVFETLKELLIDGMLPLDQLHCFHTFLQLNFIGNFSLLHHGSWIGSIIGKRILCPSARSLLNEILGKCPAEIFRELCVFIFGNPEMLKAANLVDNGMLKTICHRYLREDCSAGNNAKFH